MKKYCFINVLKPEYKENYMNIHKTAPMEILQALKDNGAEEEVIYIYRDIAIVYVKTDDYEVFMKGFGETECGKKWYQTVVPWLSEEEEQCLDADGNFNSDMDVLEKVFDLEQQLNGKLKQF